MRQGTALGVVALAAASSFAASARAQPFDGCPSAPIMARFVEFGRTGLMPPDLGRWLNDPVAQKVEPWKPFDNVHYVGICWVSAWLIETEDGSVLIDTLYGPFTRQLVENLESTGVDLENIRYVFMTHGHFDHAGGAAALKPLLPDARFVMTRRGWDEAIESAARSEGRRAWKMIEPDVVAEDGDSFEVGGNTFRVYETPGHTWGTASFTYDVREGGKTYRAVTIGGLGLNAIEGPAQAEAYIESVDRIARLAERDGENVEVHLTTHGFSNELEEDRARLAERAAGEPNVLVDSEGLLEQVAGLRGRAEERLETERNR